MWGSFGSPSYLDHGNRMSFLLGLNWLAVAQIILIDILLGGDNAIVIALACRNLPPSLRMRGIVWGTLGAIALRIALIAFAVNVLQMPYLKLVGGSLLLWIGIKLLAESEFDRDKIRASERLVAAVKTIIVADFVMSLDNVIAVASAADQSGSDNQLALVVFGIAVSIPIIVWGSTIVLKLMDRLPIIVTLGAGLLGYLGGAMIFTDVALISWIQSNMPHHVAALPGFGVAFSIPGLLGALGVVAVGHWYAARRRESDDRE
jgi:YjbE family integral membrane protein